MTDISVYIEAILSLGIFGLLALATKLWADINKLRDAAISFIDACNRLMTELKKANDDGGITQEEFTKLVDKLKAVMRKGKETIESGEAVVDDLEMIRDRLLKIIKSRQEVQAEPDVEAEVKEEAKTEEPKVEEPKTEEPKKEVTKEEQISVNKKKLKEIFEAKDKKTSDEKEDKAIEKDD